MLIGDPLGEGSDASSTIPGERPITELWGAESGELIPQNERELTYFLLIFFVLASRKFPPNLGQVEFTVVTGELERNRRACLSLTRASLSLSSRRRGRGMSRETSLLSPSLILRPRWARTPGCSGSDLDFIEPYPGLSADQPGTP